MTVTLLCSPHDPLRGRWRYCTAFCLVFDSLIRALPYVYFRSDSLAALPRLFVFEFRTHTV